MNSPVLSMNTPQISIIIPVYKAAEYLSPLMQQLYNQTVQDFEVIFVNDCSPDNSAVILNQLAEEDERIRVFHHERNKCQGAARNTGLDNAHGEYIIYIDADDSIPDNYLEFLYTNIEKNDADLVICNSIWVYPNREIRRNMFIDNPNLPELLLTGEEALKRFYSVFQDDIRIPVEPWGRIIRRSMIDKYHLRNPETLHEDVVMCFSELLFSRKILFLNKYLYYYNRKNTSSVILERKKQYLLEFPNIFIGFYNVLIENGLYDENKKWMTRFYFGFLAGVYETYSKGEVFSEEMKQAVLRYRTLLNDPLIEGSEEYISNKLIDFKMQMNRYNLTDIFSLFIEFHPELQFLLRKNIRFCFLYYSNQCMRYKFVRQIYKRIVIDPMTQRRRLYITHLLHLYQRASPLIKKRIR